MDRFRFLTIEELIKELDNYEFTQLHIHHTWKPAHSSFDGENHIKLQEGMYHYHTVVNGWDDIGQHLTLFPDGKWLTGRPFHKTPASISGWNTGALAVEMLGNFDLPGTGEFNSLGYDRLEGRQREEILKLIKYFIDRYGEKTIIFHRDNPNTKKTCPGTSLSKEILIQEAKLIHEPSPWAKESWQWAIKNGITDGTNPKGLATREQVVTMIYRAMNLSKNGVD